MTQQRPLQADDVKRFWRGRAGSVKDSKEVTHPDLIQRDMEIHAILRHLTSKDDVLDVGCGTGYATQLYAENAHSVLGIDSVSEMIDRANSEHSHPRARYECLDVLQLRYKEEFNIAISTRMLINILDRRQQFQAIGNITRALKSGGRFFFMEGCANGRQYLSQQRKKVGLEVLPKVEHNLDFDEEEVCTYLQQAFSIEHVQKFGIYDFLTRLFFPLLTLPNPPQYNTVVHEKALKVQETISLPCTDTYSRMIFIIARKK